MDSINREQPEHNRENLGGTTPSAASRMPSRRRRLAFSARMGPAI